MEWPFFYYLIQPRKEISFTQAMENDEENTFDQYLPLLTNEDTIHELFKLMFRATKEKSSKVHQDFFYYLPRLIPCTLR